MGIYINKGNEGFRQTRNSEYIDKSGLIGLVNKTLFTRQKMSCVTRCRRFGKSVAAEMLAAYYDRSCDSRSLFADLEIAKDPSFEQHLNKYPVIYVDMTAFTSGDSDEDIVSNIQKELIDDISKAYPQVEYQAGDHLMKYLQQIVVATSDHFIFIIDEWDAVIRIYDDKPQVKDDFVNLLRRMFKDVSSVDVFAGVYMTGILPIKKYKTESALNNFREYSMVEPRKMARFFGFTKEEVRALAEKYQMDSEELVKWYDGYQIGDEQSMFNPNSVMQAINGNHLTAFWWGTSSINKIEEAIYRNIDGICDELYKLSEGHKCTVNTNQSNSYWLDIRSKNDILTTLIHFGYLTFDKSSQCFIPNRETLLRLSHFLVDTARGSLSDSFRQHGINYDRETKQHSCQIE